MTEYHYYKASPTIAPVETVTIVIDKEIPEFKSLTKARTFYQREGELLCERLFDVLPGGTFDQLLAAMMLKKASLLRVPFEEVE